MPVSIETISSFVPETRLDVLRDHATLGIDSAVARVISQIYELPSCPVSNCSDEELLFNAALGLADIEPAHRIVALVD
ncbi:hypothetical protein DUT91_24675 [Phyllobacterium salinisoli]|uniref:Uncharacterized protein n=1 Tax=Phyllobacterium salinisoli TaxID=1899321 RepID=A0A368JYU9_9HYPH|nr:hypothetical protein DUT91_24675 [Phyllobacterium salinisoli]